MRRAVLGGTVVVAALLPVALTACGIGGDGELQQVDPADLAGLDATSSTTTSVPLQSVPPSTAPPDETSTTIATEAVELYFVDGSRLQSVSLNLARPASPSRVIAALASGPPEGDLGIGLRSALPNDLVNFVDETNAGYATVDLAAEPFQLIDPADQRDAIAQIVLTLVRRPGIGQVGFTLDGAPMRVPRADGLQTEPGATVSLQDYQSMLTGAATTTTTTVAPTVPAPVVTPVPG